MSRQKRNMQVLKPDVQLFSEAATKGKEWFDTFEVSRHGQSLISAELCKNRTSK